MENLKQKDIEKTLIKELKDTLKSLNKEDCEKFLPLNVREWVNMRQDWVNTEIRINHTWYNVTDEKASEIYIISITERLCKELSTKKITLIPFDDGHHLRGVYFLVLCKEFGQLQKYLQNKANLLIEPKDLYQVSVCGKRHSWSEGHRHYIANNEKECSSILKRLKEVVGRNRLTAQVVTSNVEYENEEDYRIAQYQESEWYGQIITRLMLRVTTPSHKVKEIPYMGEWFMAWK